ncbi:hypothetical protein KUL25_02750 [Rhodobacteraceae bacterium N5(2021)]|uniref:Uncharacterized protein n=1 Tax=Gymnodinialimonas phycosphaerae TaxID=2841589 RepID=A0A975YGL3_9RHOB|nr:hypothetical protein [Gymnodinialimonas phycosphaerae]MBY4891680.1 hypothetical protein [Gymnodinialimonas phycosphaerae]
MGFLAIALGLLGIATFMGVHVVQETRIGRGLIFEGATAQALIVTAERTERTQCSRSQRSVCWPANTHVATVVFEVEGLRSGAELRLSPDEYTAYESGAEVFIDLIYLPSDPTQVERTRGARLNAAERDTVHIYVLLGFGVLFAAIGIIALLLGRKQTAPPPTDTPPSTGTGR